MSPNQSLAVVRRYHHGWTSRNYEQAIGQLAPTLKVEVPINDYPTAESFAQALRAFGEMVHGVEMLSEMSNEHEAMLLYDMHVEQLGPLRVAEHFTVANGKIARLRQMHDTAAVRAAGLGPATASSTAMNIHATDDYTRTVPLSTAREKVFDALATIDGLAGWWTPLVSGNPTAGGELEFAFRGLDEKIVVRVQEATRPSTVIWTCVTHTGHPEWAGTTIVFALHHDDDSPDLLRFRHAGLNRSLDCYQTCESGWEHFLASLLSYAQHGEGNPF